MRALRRAVRRRRRARRAPRGVAHVVGAHLERPADGEHAADGAENAGQHVRERQAWHAKQAGQEIRERRRRTRRRSRSRAASLPASEWRSAAPASSSTPATPAQQTRRLSMRATSWRRMMRSAPAAKQRAHGERRGGAERLHGEIGERTRPGRRTDCASAPSVATLRLGSSGE